MTRCVRPQANRLLLLLVLAGCVETGTVSGNPPERLTRELPNTGPAATPSRAELYKRRQAEAAKGATKVEEAAPDDRRIGVDATHVFHRADCPLLADVPVAQQVRFTSQWDALDGGYRPCEECKSAR